MAKLISKTYGDALLSIAVEEDKLDSFDEEVVALREVLKDNPDLGSCINNPRISVDDKLDIISNVFTGRITDELLGFLKSRRTDSTASMRYWSISLTRLRN